MATPPNTDDAVELVAWIAERPDLDGCEDATDAIAELQQIIDAARACVRANDF